MPELTTEDILEGFASDVEGFYAVIDDDDNLSDDDKDTLTRKFEEIEELVRDARKLVRNSVEQD